MSRGVGTCPYPDCGRVIDGDEIKRQAQAGQMGEQLFAAVYKERVVKILKSGKRGKDKWVRGYRAPRPEDNNAMQKFRRNSPRSCPSGKPSILFRARESPTVNNDQSNLSGTGWNANVAGSVLAAPASLPRHERRGLPRNARCRPDLQVG